MKNTLFKVIFISLFISCTKSGFKNEHGTVFSSEKLNGHYKMDITPFVDEELEKSEGKSESENLAANIAAFAFQNSVSVDVFFKSNGEGVMKMNTGSLGKLFGVKDERVDFKYELKDDSILVLNSKNNSFLTVRKFTDSFDYIELVNKGESKAVTLEKIAE